MRYTSVLPPTKINVDHAKALFELADKRQTSVSQLVRQAIAEFLINHGSILGEVEQDAVLSPRHRS